MKEIPLTQGKVALVDDDDYALLSRFKWNAAHIQRRWYAVRTEYHPKKINIRMHRVILDATPGLDVDHKDGDGLNNQRLNLRQVTRAKNGQAFCRKKPGCSSKYRGVTWNKTLGRWAAQVRAITDGKVKNFGGGYYDTEEQAALAYNWRAYAVGFPVECFNKVA